MADLPQLGIFIDRPIDQVFAFVLDLQQTPRWRPRMSSVGWVGGSPPGVGSRFRVIVRMLGISFPFELEVTEFDPPHRFAYRQRTGTVKVDASMEWLADGDGCRYFISGRLETDNLLLRIATPIFRSSLLWQDWNDLLRLKAVLEG